MVCAQLLDLVGAWDAADGAQRTRLLAGLFEHIKAPADPSGEVHVVAVPRPGWRSSFEQILPLERETGFSRSGAAYSAGRSGIGWRIGRLDADATLHP